ncbi:MAG: aspartate aminotransferase family protein [Desulfobacteraceae bacterium]|nr:aspartate aminotransferase family protein [Desulfobacteraceae bacterium]
MTRDNAYWIERSNRYFLNTYSRYPAAMVEGSGCRLKDADGREYLDFLSGIAVCSLGHCYPPVVEAVCAQARKLMHVSNLYHTAPQTELAELLVTHSFADQVFLANSGAEANEAAIKLARKFGSATGRYEIISLEGSFHGRTLATVAATGQTRFHKGFEPMPEGFRAAPFGDIDALAAMIAPHTCAILVEPLQGEGGVRPLEEEYLRSIRRLCDERGLLLIFDEIQVGMGRTGTLFAYEQLGVVPDILTLAKAVGNGLPLGAMLATERVGAAFVPGDHASTFGGNPVACAAAAVTVKTMLANGFLADVREKGEHLAARLARVAAHHAHLAAGVRGRGLIQGLVLRPEAVAKGPLIVNRLFEQGILLNFAGGTTLRCLPPLVVSRAEIDTFVNVLDLVMAAV